MPPDDQGGKHDKRDQERACGTSEGGAIAEVSLAPTRHNARIARSDSMTTSLATIRDTASGDSDCV